MDVKQKVGSGQKFSGIFQILRRPVLIGQDIRYKEYIIQNLFAGFYNFSRLKRLCFGNFCIVSRHCENKSFPVLCIQILYAPCMKGAQVLGLFRIMTPDEEKPEQKTVFKFCCAVCRQCLMPGICVDKAFGFFPDNDKKVEFITLCRLFIPWFCFFCFSHLQLLYYFTTSIWY
ncbi:MAG: hypothetical protein M3O22_07545 [Pseudomonadota bacterium]|nr:hypothetical protein [Pseudomonadota bacterium]